MCVCVPQVETSVAERRRLAVASHGFNRKTPIFCELFPDEVRQVEADAPSADAADADAAGAQQQQAAERPAFPVYVGLVAVVAVAVGIAYVVREL